MGDVKAFLESTSIPDVQRWCEVFEEEGIDMEALKNISESDLKDVGMSRKGDRVKVILTLKSIRQTERSLQGHEQSTSDTDLAQTTEELPTNQMSESDHSDTFTSSIQENEAELETTESESDENDKYEGVFSKYNSWNAEEEMEETNPSNQEKEAKIESIEIQSGNADEEKEETNPGDASSLLSKISSRKSESKLLLNQTYKHMLELFTTDVIFKDLQDEVTTEYGDITSIIRQRISDLANDDCPIVVAGETSAGKSSFVNLLLGADLLPKTTLPCTSTICRIYNQKEKHLYVTDFNDQQTLVTKFENSGKDITDLKRLLKEFVQLDTEQETQKHYKYVDIHWQIPHLHDDIVIVDTPGIDPDNTNLMKRLFEYLPNALAFIYLLNTPNAGGVQSDRILKIQTEIAKHHHDDKEYQFDPNRAIFICNKWDQVHEDENYVFESVKRKLTKAWIGFDQSKLLKLSTFEEQKTLKESKQDKQVAVSCQFKEVLKAIQNMLPAAVEEKIQRNLLWQTNLMEGLLHKLAVRSIHTLKSSEEKEKHLNEVSLRLKHIQIHGDSLFKDITEETEKKCNAISDELFRHIHSQKIKSRMFSWTNDDLPDLGSMDEIKNSIKDDIKKRVEAELRCTVAKHVENLLTELKTFIQEKIYETVTVMVEIDQFMLNEPDHLIRKKFLTSVNHPFAAGFTFGSGVLAALVFSALSGVGIWAIQGENRKDKEIYKSDKVALANRLGCAYLESFTVKYFKRIGDDIKNNALKSLTSYFKDILPKRIKAKQNLVKNIKKDMRTPNSIRKQCQQTENNVKPVYGHIMLAHILLFGENTLTDGDVRIQWSIPSKVLTSCEIRQKEQWIPANATVKPGSLNNPIGWKELADIYCFSKHMHKNIIRFYGISLLEKCADKGLVIYSEKITCRLDEISLAEDLQWTACRKLLLEVIEGLSYQHDKGSVHKNLKLESIGIIKHNENMQAKLCMGDTIDPTSLSGAITGVPIVVAPEVKNGEPFGFETDIYQFGIILYECICKKRAFCKDGKSEYSTYKELYACIEKNEVIFHFQKTIADADLCNLIIKCCSLDPTSRPTAKHAKRSLEH